MWVLLTIVPRQTINMSKCRNQAKPMRTTNPAQHPCDRGTGEWVWTIWGDGTWGMRVASLSFKGPDTHMANETFDNLILRHRIADERKREAGGARRTGLGRYCLHCPSHIPSIHICRSDSWHGKCAGCSATSLRPDLCSCMDSPCLSTRIVAQYEIELFLIRLPHFFIASSVEEEGTQRRGRTA
jgi:hypothetical protein